MAAPGENNKRLVIDYLTLRKAIGWLGILLPFALLIGNYVVNNLDVLNQSFFVRTECQTPYVPDGSYKISISHYYYTTTDELFTGVLCAVALFMFCYTGHPLRQGEKGLSDKTMTNLAGIFALGIVVFPTSSESCIKDNMRTFLSSDFTGSIHFISAALFFITLSILSIVNFRRTDSKELFGKKDFHGLYLWCGRVMLLSLLLILIYKVFLEGKIPGLDFIHPTFILETIALMAFGLSWLTKGKVDYKFIPRMLKLIPAKS